MGLNVKYPWDQEGKRIVLTDGKMGAGRTVIENREELGIVSGGFTALTWKELFDKYGLVEVETHEKAMRVNILHADAVLICTHDPRTQEVDRIIAESRSHKLRTRVQLDDNPRDLGKWLTEHDVRVLHVAGDMNPPTTLRLFRDLVPQWTVR